MTHAENRFIHSKLYPNECWHEFDDQHGLSSAVICYKCKRIIRDPNPNYYTMPVEKLIARLVELGWWESAQGFAHFIATKYWNGEGSEYKGVSIGRWEAWAFQQPRFTTLLGDYLQKERVGAL